MRMQVILVDSSFARPGSAPIWGRKKGESRDWTRVFDVSSQSKQKLRGKPRSKIVIIYAN